jgi:carbon-monoxide dehydrogenase medium subunit
MKTADLRPDPLRALRESVAPLEDASEAEARARRLHGTLSAAIRAVPEQRRVEARRKLVLGSAAAVLAAAAALAAAHCEPSTDQRGPADYKRHLAGELTQRALKRAIDRARGM